MGKTEEKREKWVEERKGYKGRKEWTKKEEICYIIYNMGCAFYYTTGGENQQQKPPGLPQFIYRLQWKIWPCILIHDFFELHKPVSSMLWTVAILERIKTALSKADKKKKSSKDASK